MRDTSENTQWKKIPKILFRSWPLGLGAVLAFPGGIMTYWMILALDPNEHWALTLCTVLLILAFLFMTGLGIYFLLMPLETLWVSREEIQLRLGSIVLRRIPTKDVRSIVSEVRNVLVKNRDADLYRLKIYPDGKWPKSLVLWLDWSTSAEEILKEILGRDIILLF